MKQRVELLPQENISRKIVGRKIPIWIVLVLVAAAGTQSTGFYTSLIGSVCSTTWPTPRAGPAGLPESVVRIHSMSLQPARDPNLCEINLQILLQARPRDDAGAKPREASDHGA